MKRIVLVVAVVAALVMWSGCTGTLTIHATEGVHRMVFGGDDAGLMIRNNTPYTVDIQAGPFQFIKEPGGVVRVSYRAWWYTTKSLHVEIAAMPDASRVGTIRSAKTSWDFSEWYNNGSYSVTDERVITLELSEDGKEFYFK